MLSTPEVLEHRVSIGAAQETHLLHHERHPSRNPYLRRSPLDILLYSVAEGAHRSGRTSLVSAVYGQRGGYYTKDIGPRATPRQVLLWMFSTHSTRES